MASIEKPDQPANKQIRLSLACNPCRKRKVRCDARQPKCRNCSLRGDICETSDLRKPGKTPGVRRRATAKQGSRRDSSATQALTSPTALSQSLSAHTPASGSSGGSDGAQEGPGMSWVARGYAWAASKPLSYASVVSPDAVVHTDKTSMSPRFKIMGASSLQSLFCFVDLHLGEMGYPPSRPMFDQGMRYSVEFSIPLTPPVGLFHLPSPDECSDAVDAFYSTIWPLFPVVHRPTVLANIARFTEMQTKAILGQQLELEPGDLPSLATVYAILCIGCDEITGHPTDDSTLYLTLGYNLLPHLFAQPYLSSIQALLLLGLAFRGRSKDGQTFQLVAQAIRMAQSMGLQKRDSSGHEIEDDLYQRVWWSCHALEKLNQLESGRPSICSGQEGTYILPRNPQGNDLDGGPGEHFPAWVSLSNIMGHISERLYMHKFVSSKDMLVEMANLHQALLDWQKSLPDSIRPGSAGGLSSSALSTDSSISHISQAQMTILRASLLFPHSGFVQEIKKRKADLPRGHRLANGSALCANAARETISQYLHLADHGIQTTLLGTTQALQAAVVLAIGILRQPGKRLARADMELLRLAIEYVEEYYTRWGQDPVYINLFLEWRDRLAEVVQRRSQAGQGPDQSLRQNQHGHIADLDSIGTASTEDFDMQGMESNLFGDWDFEEFWKMMDMDLTVG
ncbi:fungal-specific transcription factor domain-containing protein [Plectosphaerella plurivora]|uniref:Fungal-specific transcription factor domain-containing protein n=1 Tax=Plectosphaerella plurivora TaxID=936078 RepID=A0A9P8UY72_9PEZI|nr:fungal-specific transcription factor domain-containing protein [Plectosphaerella plurivora]